MEPETINLFTSEILKNARRQSMAQGHSLEFMEGALEFLLTKTQKKLDEKERAQFLVMLSKYPKWKLLQIDGFSGSLGQIFTFLDAIQSEPQDSYSELGYDRERHLQITDTSSRAELEKKCSIELFAGIRKIMADQSIDRGNHKEAISKLHDHLREKYPMFKESLKC